MRIALLANPESGAGGANDVGRLLADRGAQVERFELDDCDAAAASAPDRIVVAGGDGSVACVAEVAGRADIPLAVVPVGTANDFARALDLPRDPIRAVTLAIDGTRSRRLDLGSVDGDRPFVNAVSTGLSPVAARKAHGLKRALGPLAYAVGALRAGLSAQPVDCSVRCEGDMLFSGEAWQVTVGLTGAFGGGAEVAADPRDGILDVVAVEAGSRPRLIAHAYGMRAGRVERQRGVISGRGSEIEIETDGRTGFNIDGEIVAARSLRLSVLPRAFEVVTG
jgi:diacylglycerol kinase (ATP)